MDLTLLIKGIGLGLAIAAPVGPIGVLCIRRTLAYGRLSGWVSGLGAATADALYGCLAALGFTLATPLIDGTSLVYASLRVLGGFFLLYLGISTFRSYPATEAVRAPRQGLWRAYLSTLFLTITNPLTILSFAAIFAGLGAGASGDAVLLVLGVFCGSALWWSLLCGGVGLFRGALERHTRWINRISGVVIVGFALATLLG